MLGSKFLKLNGLYLLKSSIANSILALFVRLEASGFKKVFVSLFS